jgi:bifunctional non-homologous end joining protein LigD
VIAKTNNSEKTSEIGSHNLAVAQRRLFVMKKHDATRLHYDLRLGHCGVLLSWAIPDGPSYWPGYPREAIEVEDHRRENAFFEGVIPEGYGAGTVMVWDWGTWAPLQGYTDVDAGLRNGLLKFILEGEKLKGNWVLARVFRLGESRRNSVWMLTKEKDSFARSESAASILEEAPNSIATRRTLDEIAEDWSGGRRKNKVQRELFDE